MLYYALVFLVVALLAATGLRTIGGSGAMEIARILFFLFLVLFLVFLLSHAVRGRKAS